MILVGLALAQDYRFPVADEDITHMYPTAYKDHSGVDWACGSIRYSGHNGSDFGGGGFDGMADGRTIVAAAPGTVTYTHDGEFDECTTGDCAGGGGFGNYVVVEHPDGKVTYYAHLKKWSVAVSTGQSVSCGTALGLMGSSGYSTGPHLHFEVRDGGVAHDPFDGDCSSPPSYWVSQGSHGGVRGLRRSRGRPTDSDPQIDTDEPHVDDTSADREPKTLTPGEKVAMPGCGCGSGALTGSWILALLWVRRVRSRFPKREVRERSLG